MEITWRVFRGEGAGGAWGKRYRGIRSIIGRHKRDREEVKNCMGNGEAKELIGMTHGYELRVGNAGWQGEVTGQRGIKWRKKWDNCSNIINKIIKK